MPEDKPYKNKAFFSDKIDDPEHFLSELDTNTRSFAEKLMNKFPGGELVFTSGQRDKKEGDKFSHHHEGNAIDLRANPKIWNYLVNDSEGLKLMVDHGFNIIDESDPQKLKKTKGSAAHFHIGKDTPNDIVLDVRSRYYSYNGIPSNVSNDKEDNLLESMGAYSNDLPANQEITYSMPKIESYIEFYARETGNTFDYSSGVGPLEEIREDYLKDGSDPDGNLDEDTDSQPNATLSPEYLALKKEFEQMKAEEEETEAEKALKAKEEAYLAKKQEELSQKQSIIQSEVSMAQKRQGTLDTADPNKLEQPSVDPSSWKLPDIDVQSPDFIYSLPQQEVQQFKEGGEKYSIKQGDTLQKISNRTGIPVHKIIEENNIENPDVIRAGEELTIPSISGDSSFYTYTVSKGDTLSKIASSNNTTVDKLKDLNSIEDVNLIRVGQNIKVPQYENTDSEENNKSLFYNTGLTSEIEENRDDINNMDNESIVKIGQSSLSPRSEYVVVDKKSNRLKVYRGQNKRFEMEVVIGANKGDAQTTTKSTLSNIKQLKELQKRVGVEPDGIYGPNTKKALSEAGLSFSPKWSTDWSRGNLSTGAGVYKISGQSGSSDDYYGGAPSINLENSDGVEVGTSIHGSPEYRRKFFGNDEDRRKKFSSMDYNTFWDTWLKSTDSEVSDIKSTTYKDALDDLVKMDNRSSNGCINGKCSDVQALYSLGLPDGTPVYILPEEENNKFQIVDGKPVFRSETNDSVFYKYKDNSKVYKKKGNSWFVSKGIGEKFVPMKDPEGKRAKEIIKNGENQGSYSYYENSSGELEKGQGINRSTNTLNYKPIVPVFDEDSFVEDVYQSLDLDDDKELEKTTKPFINSLVSNKRRVMSVASVTSDTYNELAKIAFGIYGNETNFGDTHSGVGNIVRGVRKVSSSSSSSPDYKRKYEGYPVIGGARGDNNSVGLTQIRWDYVKREPGLLKMMEEVGITSKEDLLDPEKAALATVIRLAYLTNNRKDVDKDNLFETLPKHWGGSSKDDYSTYTKNVKKNAKYIDFKQVNDKVIKPINNSGNYSQYRDLFNEQPSDRLN